MVLLRSEEMRCGTLIINTSEARGTLDLLGRIGLVQLDDMNAKSHKRPFVHQIQRIDALERILRYLLVEICGLPQAPPLISSSVDGFLDHSEVYSLGDLEKELNALQSDFQRLRKSIDAVIQARGRLLEARYVAQVAQAMAGRRGQATGAGSGRLEDYSPFSEGLQAGQRPFLLADHGLSALRVKTLAGMVHQSAQERFSRAVFRAARGNIFTHFQRIPPPIPDSKTGGSTFKSVFVLYFQNPMGFERSALEMKLRGICSAFGAELHEWHDTSEAAAYATAQLTIQAVEQKQLLDQLQMHLLQEAARLLRPVEPHGNSLIEDWRFFCAKEKAICAAMNLFEGSSTSLRTSCWYPVSHEGHLSALRQHALMLPDQIQSPAGAPTFIHRNALTEVAQQLVDLYGFPRYRQANPALLTVVTFPFLFGVMYGDLGHGMILLLLGLWLILRPEEQQRESPILHMCRYMLFLMGFFSVYVGLLYGDCFSVGIPLFSSRWHSPAGKGSHKLTPDYDALNMGGRGPYPFGVDTAWHGAANELVFMNSLKMKLSVIIAVVHMAAGLLLRVLNAVWTDSAVDLLCECLPMLVFLFCIFGFMDAMILYKWVTPLEEPPNIINSMICMLLPGQDDPSPPFGLALPRHLVSLAVCSVFVMLVPKPLILRRRAARQTDDFELGEVVLHQIIQTVEYVLGTVSHAASYLRLWALSLAHQQLSLVFFEYTIGSALQASFPLNCFAVYIMFAIWALITLTILIGVDVMECFLHTLRLHWVEFQSKFYIADGIPFEPFSFKHLLEQICQRDQ